MTRKQTSNIKIFYSENNKNARNSYAVFHCFTYYFKMMTQKLNYTELNMTKSDSFMAVYLKGMRTDESILQCTDL